MSFEVNIIALRLCAFARNGIELEMACCREKNFSILSASTRRDAENILRSLVIDNPLLISGDFVINYLSHEENHP